MEKQKPRFAVLMSVPVGFYRGGSALDTGDMLDQQICKTVAEAEARIDFLKKAYAPLYSFKVVKVLA